MLQTFPQRLLGKLKNQHDCIFYAKIDNTAPIYKCVIKKWFSDFSTKTYVAGTQNNRLSEMGLNEMVLLGTQKLM